MEQFSYKAVCGVCERTLTEVWINGFRLLVILMLFKTVIIIATTKELKNNIIAMCCYVALGNIFKLFQAETCSQLLHTTLSH